MKIKKDNFYNYLRFCKTCGNSPLIFESNIAALPFFKKYMAECPQCDTRVFAHSYKRLLKKWNSKNE